MSTFNCHYCGHPNREQDIYCCECRHRVTRDLSGKHVPAPRPPAAPAPLVVKFINVGTTCVRVRKLEINEKTGKETVVTLHEGVVVQDCGSFVRVFNPAPRDKGGDLSPEISELFALKSKRIWCEKTGERATPFPIPAVLR